MSIHDERKKGILPDWLAEIGFDFARDISKIWSVQAELPVEELSVEELVWHLDYPFFWQTNDPFSLKPRDVIENPEEYEYRFNRIMNVDPSYPIAIMYWKGHWEILDGLHRLCQAIIKGEKTVKVTKVPVEWVERIKPD